MTRRRRRPYNRKRAIDPNGLVHGYKEGTGRYGDGREATTFCGYPFWEAGIGVDKGWTVVSVRPITCVRCVAMYPK